MAKKKDDLAPKKRLGRPPNPGGPKERARIVMTIRAGETWEAWIDGLCQELQKDLIAGRVDRTDVVDAGLRALAEKLGRPAPPKRY